MKKLVLLTLIFGALLLPTQPAMADHYPDFDKNFLIDDSLFIDHNSMSVAEIQQFLDNNGSLLANWVDDVDMRRPSDNCVVHKATGMTAAEVIYEASTAWNAQIVENCAGTDVSYWGDADYSNYTMPTVSPKVLLVLLQKEQSLISANGTYSTNPNDYKDPTCCASNEYKLARATGYGVPDSGSINEQYLGFYNQINWGAWQLRYNFERSAGNTAWDEVGYKLYTGPMIEGTWKQCDTCTAVQFDGYYPIDGSSLYMGNQATASLYYYTPHTHPPFNGNSNFVIFYDQWFGVDARVTKSSPAFRDKVVQGQRFFAWIEFKNTGAITWYEKGYEGTDKPLLELVTAQPTGRASIFNEYWPGDDIAANTFYRVYKGDSDTLVTNQHRVLPGDRVKMAFMVSAPKGEPTGYYYEDFRLRLGGEDVPGSLTEVTVKMTAEDLNASVVNSSPRNQNVVQSNRELAWVEYMNNGNTPWYDSIGASISGEQPMQLVTAKSSLRSSPFGKFWGAGQNTLNDRFGAVFKSNGRTRSDNQNIVQPGEIVRIYFMLAVPGDMTPGEDIEDYRLVRGGELIDGSLIRYRFNVEASQPQAQEISVVPEKTIQKGDRDYFWVEYRNTGNVIWYDRRDIAVLAPENTLPLRLITTKPLLRTSTFGALWGDDANIPAAEFSRVYESDGSTLSKNQTMVLPGQIVRMATLATAPASIENGEYREDVRLQFDGGDYLNPLSTFQIVVE